MPNLLTFNALTNLLTQTLSILEKRMRVEMELKYEKEKNKRCRFQTLLDATTHSLSRLWDVYDPTHVEVLWFEPSGRSLSFDTPPTNNKESSYQNYFTEKILPQLDNS